MNSCNRSQYINSVGLTNQIAYTIKTNIMVDIHSIYLLLDKLPLYPHTTTLFVILIAEVRFVSAYKSVRQKERITLKSPRGARKPLALQNGQTNGQTKTGMNNFR